MDRRAFLSILAGSPLVFGLRELLAQEPAPPGKAEPEWYRAALKRMKETRRFGVVLTIPPEEKERTRMGNALVNLYNEPIQVHYEVRYSVVVICLEAGMAESRFRGDVKKANRFLLDPEGHLVHSDVMDASILESHAKFESSFRALAYGPEGARLAEQAKVIEDGLSPEKRKAGDDLMVENPEPVAAGRALMPVADSLLPWILHKYHVAEAKAKRQPEKPSEFRGSKQFLSFYMMKQTGSKGDLTLPFGVRFAERERPEVDGCPGCGMSAMPPGRRLRFVSFLEK